MSFWQIDWSYKPKQTVYVTNQKDSSGNEKKTKYWVCCHRRTTEGRQEYRLKDKAPENWDEYKNCEGDHEGYWVAEDELMEWL